MTPSPAAAREVALATSRLGAFTLALPLDQVACLAAWDDLRPAGEACLDLGALLGSPAPPQGRRLAELAGRGPEPLFVLLGEAVAVLPVELRAVHPLPPLLEGAGARFGCAGLIRRNDGFCFLLDAELLRGVARRA